MPTTSPFAGLPAEPQIAPGQQAPHTRRSAAQQAHEQQGPGRGIPTNGPAGSSSSGSSDRQQIPQEAPGDPQANAFSQCMPGMSRPMPADLAPYMHSMFTGPLSAADLSRLSSTGAGALSLAGGLKPSAKVVPDLQGNAWFVSAAQVGKA